MVSSNIKKKLSLFTTLLMLLQLFMLATPVMALETKGSAGATGSTDNYTTNGTQYMPLRPDLLNQKGLSDGAGFTSKTDSNVNSKIPDGSIKPRMSPAPKLDQFGRLLAPQVGTKKTVAIMVYFDDEPFGDEPTAPGADQNYFNDMLFDNTPGANSMRNYYKEQSYGKLDIDGIVLGPYKSVQSYVYYAQDKDTANNKIDDKNTDIYELVRESVKEAAYANPGFDWSAYDQDSNGVVDNVIIIQAGPGQEEGADPNLSIWSHQSSIPGGEPVGGLKVANYTMQPETGMVGVFAHEYGHVLGLPDLYDVTGSIEGAGNWELMGAGAWNNNCNTPAGLSAWSKNCLGWLNYTEPADDLKDVILRNTVDYPEALRLWTNGQASDTYYLVENRQKKGYDEYLPGEGLLVWWVDAPDQWMSSNNVNQPVPTLMPVEADGKYNLWASTLSPSSNTGEASDPYPGTTGNTAFTFTSTPNATTYDPLNLSSNPDKSIWEAGGLWDGLYTGVSLWNIQAQDPVASVKTYQFDATVKNGLLLTPRTGISKAVITAGESTNLEYVLLNDNTVVNIYVKDGYGNTVRNLVTNSTENKGTHSTVWDGKNNSGSYVSAGNYKIQINTSVTSTNTNDPLGKGSSAQVTATSSHELAVQVTSSSAGGGGGGGGGGTTTSDETNIDDSELDDAISEAKESGSVEISTSDEEVQLNEEQLGKIADTDKPVTVSVGSIDIVLPSQLVERLAVIGSARVTAEAVAAGAAQSIMGEAVNGSQYKLVDNVYELSIKADDKEFKFNSGETVTAEMPVSAQAKTLALGGKLTVGYYNPTDKKWEDMGAKYDEKKNAMVFTTSHFSKYAVLEKTGQADIMKKPVVITLSLNNTEAQINGYKYSLDAKPYLDTKVNRTLVPVRFISEALGCKVDWIAKDNKVEIRKGSNLIVLTLGSKEAVVNGQKSMMDSAPGTLPPGRTFVPLRFISETLGTTVVYDQATQTIKISDN